MRWATVELIILVQLPVWDSVHFVHSKCFEQRYRMIRLCIYVHRSALSTNLTDPLSTLLADNSLELNGSRQWQSANVNVKKTHLRWGHTILTWRELMWCYACSWDVRGDLTLNSATPIHTFVTLLTSRDLTWSSGRFTRQHASHISVVAHISWGVTPHEMCVNKGFLSAEKNNAGNLACPPSQK